MIALLCLLLGVHAGTVEAQRTRIPFERIAQERGLSNGSVTAIAQDRHGFLWIGTQDGLNRYDGVGFTLFRPVRGDTTSLSDGWVTALAASRTGAIWVGTLQRGVHRFIPGSSTFRRYGHVPGDSTSLSSDRTNTLVEGRDGQLWIGTDRGLDRLDPGTGRVQRFAPVPADPTDEANDVLAVAEQPDGRLWVGTRGGLFRFDPASGRFDSLEIGLRTPPIFAVLLDRRGTLWVGADDELVTFDPAVGEVRTRYRAGDPARPSVPFGGRVMVLHEGPDGTIWLGSNEGLAALDPVAGTFVRHRYDPANRRSLGGNLVRAILVDRGGVLWVGLESYGLAKHAPSVVHFDLITHNPSARHSLSDGYVRGIIQDREGHLWIGTQFGGLNQLHARTGEVIVHRHRPGDPRSLPGDNVWAVLEDRQGTLWVGLGKAGLGTLDRRDGTFRRSPLVEPHWSVNVLYEDRSGALLVGLERGGVLEISPDRRRVVHRYGATVGDQRVLVDDDVQDIFEDSQGMLWIGGDGGLTMLDRRTGRAMHFVARPGVPGALENDFITNIFEDSRGIIWVATKGGGVSRYDRRRERFVTLGTAEGLPHAFVYGILEDARHNLWLSTEHGIAALDPETGLVTRYDLRDGLQALEFNRRAFFRGRDGTMYFGGINGVNVFRPDEVVAPPPPPPVSLVSLRVADERPRPAARFTSDSVVRLRPNQGGLTIAFTALDFSTPEKTTFRYRLDGVDRDWVLAGERREATYPSLPPGRYEFRVTAANAVGAWSASEAGVTIVVDPPWWGTWWARVLGVLLLVGVPVLAMRLRLRAIRRRSAWLEQRVEEQTRDLTEAQERLRASLERERAALRELFEITAAVPGAVFQLREAPDGTRSFRFVSDGIAELAGDADARQERPRELAERILNSVHADDAERVARSLAASRESLMPLRLEWRWRPTADTVRWLAVQAHPSREADGSVVWTGVATDVTAARRAEAERAALEAKMLEAQKAESLAILAGGIAHDFNNLLVGVLAGADLLRYETPLTGDAAETVDHIRTAALRAAELTQQMLAYAGKGKFLVQRLDLAEVVREMLALLRSAVPRTIAFDFQAGDEPAVVEADATQLRQVVLNLVTNAGEAIGAAAGKVTVRVGVERAPRRALGLLHASADMPLEGPYAVLEVQDDGCGMDPALLTRIFEPFFSTKFTGRGLGLAALVGIVRAHHGGVRVDTAPGRGTTFRIYLPLAAADVLRARPAIGDGAGSSDGECARVLVVDDEEQVRVTLERLLGRLGYEVVVARDGEEALALSRREPGIDVVLMDVAMPQLDGPATARTLRSVLDAPIVLMSGYTEDELVARGAMTDADAFLKKPFSTAELAAVLRQLTARRGRTRVAGAAR